MRKRNSPLLRHLGNGGEGGGGKRDWGEKGEERECGFYWRGSSGSYVEYTSSKIVLICISFSYEI